MIYVLKTKDKKASYILNSLLSVQKFTNLKHVTNIEDLTDQVTKKYNLYCYDNLQDIYNY